MAHRKLPLCQIHYPYVRMKVLYQREGGVFRAIGSFCPGCGRTWVDQLLVADLELSDRAIVYDRRQKKGV